MEEIIIQSANYIIILFMAIYTIKCFTVFRYTDKAKQNSIFIQQNILMFAIHFIAYAILFIQNPDEKILLYYGMQFILILFILLMYNAVYPDSSRLIINNMCMLIIIGCIYITSTNSKAIVKHFAFILAGIIISVFLPFIIRKIKLLKNIWYVYAIVGILVLLLMRMFEPILGAHIEMRILGFGFQPQEFIKILYVFMIASIFEKRTDFKNVVISGVLAAVHILILVWGSDLGVALIFSFIYIIMVFIATTKSIYFVTGVSGSALAFVVGYKLFTHVQNRVFIWLNPWKDYLGIGYQIVLSMFAMTNGGWLGVGLGRGQAKFIPIVTSDLMIVPIIEESGLIFAMLIILICISCFIMFLNISSVFSDNFYKLLAIGLGSAYIVQVLLTVGGATKFIPMTGVTLPLISYGGSSILSTIISFSIIQGLYVIYGTNKKSNISVKNQQNINKRRANGKIDFKEY